MIRKLPIVQRTPLLLRNKAKKIWSKLKSKLKSLNLQKPFLLVITLMAKINLMKIWRNLSKHIHNQNHKSNLKVTKVVKRMRT